MVGGWAGGADPFVAPCAHFWVARRTPRPSQATAGCRPDCTRRVPVSASSSDRSGFLLTWGQLAVMGQSLRTPLGGSYIRPSSLPTERGTLLSTQTGITPLPNQHRAPESASRQGLRACSLTSGCSGRTAGRTWPRRVDAAGRPWVSLWLQSCWEGEGGEPVQTLPAPPPYKGLLPMAPTFRSCLCPYPHTEPGPVCFLHPKPTVNC